MNLPIAEARDLSPRERSVCSSLRACIDITSRHDASEFDYDVLEAEFRRFGFGGKQALFTLLDSDKGQSDIARLISRLGPLTTQDRQRIQSQWSTEKAKTYLPLLLDGHPMSRDLLLKTLGYSDADVREQARRALVRLPEYVQRAPISTQLQKPLLAALVQDPNPVAATYLARISPAGHEPQFAKLLSSGDTEIVTAAYSALYRYSPAKAFNTLLGEMARFETPAQSRAVGMMLARRNASRPDGFYLKFARDMSGDPKLSIPARASGLHGYLTIADGAFPELTPPRSEAFSFLVKSEPFLTQNYYLPYIKAADSDAGLDLIWNIARAEKWTNRDRIAAFFTDHRLNQIITTNLLQASDIRSFTEGLRRAEPEHTRFIRAQIDHPVSAIAAAARQKLKLSAPQARTGNCLIGAFDLEDIRAQMPFFDEGWTVAQNSARVSLPRSTLTTAHPSSSGWLAGYDLSRQGRRGTYSGGALLHHDNKSGAFKPIGKFQGPVAILPSQPLRLGQTTNQFWVIDASRGGELNLSAYKVDIGGVMPRISHMGALPVTASSFAVAPNGDLLIAFDGKKQMPIRLSKTGGMSFACSPNRASNTPRAPQ